MHSVHDFKRSRLTGLGLENRESFFTTAAQRLRSFRIRMESPNFKWKFSGCIQCQNGLLAAVASGVSPCKAGFMIGIRLAPSTPVPCPSVGSVPSKPEKSRPKGRLLHFLMGNQTEGFSVKAIGPILGIIRSGKAPPGTDGMLWAMPPAHLSLGGFSKYRQDFSPLPADNNIAYPSGYG